MHKAPLKPIPSLTFPDPLRHSSLGGRETSIHGPDSVLSPAQWLSKRLNNRGAQRLVRRHALEGLAPRFQRARRAKGRAKFKQSSKWEGAQVPHLWCQNPFRRPTEF